VYCLANVLTDREAGHEFEKTNVTLRERIEDEGLRIEAMLLIDGGRFFDLSFAIRKLP
jgi:hypothetical protein